MGKGNTALAFKSVGNTQHQFPVEKIHHDTNCTIKSKTPETVPFECFKNEDNLKKHSPDKGGSMVRKFWYGITYSLMFEKPSKRPSGTVRRSLTPIYLKIEDNGVSRNGGNMNLGCFSFRNDKPLRAPKRKVCHGMHWPPEGKQKELAYKKCMHTKIYLMVDSGTVCIWCLCLDTFNERECCKVC